jgi:uncharacterized protein
MKYYFYKLIPPRPNFSQSMTGDEIKIMQSHVQYWTDILNRGLAVAFGPVADLKGDYGVGIIQLPDDSDPSTLSTNDPAIKADAGFTCEIYPAPRVMLSP